MRLRPQAELDALVASIDCRKTQSLIGSGGVFTVSVARHDLTPAHLIWFLLTNSASCGAEDGAAQWKPCSTRVHTAMHGLMPRSAALHAPPHHPHPNIQGDLWLGWIAAQGQPGEALPVSAGGVSGTLADLTQAMAALARCAPGAARVLWAQRLCIEQLHQASNRAVAEHLLPDLIAGHRAGACLLPDAQRIPLAGRRRDRAWRLYGSLGSVTNLQWAGHVLVAPVHFEDDQRTVVLLSGDQDGIRRGPDHDGAHWHGTRTARLDVEGVFFRDDEILDSEADALDARVLAVRQALCAGLDTAP